jgi:hypothetical protein
MMYLTGSWGHKDLIPHLVERRIGIMATPNIGNSRDPSWIWAADSGCFNQKTYRGDSTYLDWLGGMTTKAKSNCLFATAPDIVGHGQESLARSLPFLPLIRELGYQVALVTQDGMTPDMLPWDEFDWIFIGGTDAHKLGQEAKDIIREAKIRRKRIHVGRVNSRRRFTAFSLLGCDTSDGTHLGFNPSRNLPEVMSWMRQCETQYPLPLETQQETGCL